MTSNDLQPLIVVGEEVEQDHDAHREQHHATDNNNYVNHVFLVSLCFFGKEMFLTIRAMDSSSPLALTVILMFPIMFFGVKMFF